MLDSLRKSVKLIEAKRSENGHFEKEKKIVPLQGENGAV